MAKRENDRGTPATTATSATRDNAALKWRRVKIAEDEISELWRETAKIENAEQAFEAAQASQVDNFWPSIEELANQCDEVLQEHGFPKAAEMVRHDGTVKWWRAPLDASERPQTGETWKVARGYALAHEFSDDFSDAWYAGRIGFKCRLALEHFQKGDSGTPHLFSLIFEIATLRNDWQWRRGNKPSILTGRKQRKTLDEYRGTAHEIQRERVLERHTAIKTILQEMNRNLTGGALTDYLSKRLLERFGIEASQRTIRRDLRKIM